MNNFKRLVPILLVFMLVAPPAFSQVEPRPEDVSTIDGIMKAYYEVVSAGVGEVADAARDSSLHHADAWIAIAGSDSTGKPLVNILTLADFYGDNLPKTEGFFEWETDREVRRSGNMVHVWSHYASSRTPRGEVFDTGVNSITLFHDGTRYWIMNWMFDGDAE